MSIIQSRRLASPIGLMRLAAVVALTAGALWSAQAHAAEPAACHALTVRLTEQPTEVAEQLQPLAATLAERLRERGLSDVVAAHEATGRGCTDLVVEFEGLPAPLAAMLERSKAEDSGASGLLGSIGSAVASVGSFGVIMGKVDPRIVSGVMQMPTGLIGKAIDAARHEGGFLAGVRAAITGQVPKAEPRRECSRRSESEVVVCGHGAQRLDELAARVRQALAASGRATVAALD